MTSSHAHPFLSLYENCEAGGQQQRDSMPWLAFGERGPTRQSPWNGSPVEGACAPILLTNSANNSIADDFTIFCAGFVTGLFLFLKVLLGRGSRAQNQNIRQD